MSARLLSLLLLAVGSPSIALAVGEGDGPLPSWDERALHFYTDELRVDPGAVDPQFDNYPRLPPLIFNPDLGAAAHAYATDMAENGCFPADHSSCDGTSFFDRVEGYYTGQDIGENISRGYGSPSSAVREGWLYSDVHRDTLLDERWVELGAGFARGDDPFWVQDFGARGGVTEPIITSGLHRPENPWEDAFVAWYVAVRDHEGSPGGVRLAYDGQCFPLSHDRGSGGYETWTLTESAGAPGCRPYVFILTRGSGEVVTYPSTGALVMAVESQCDIWSPTRPDIECLAVADGAAPPGAGEGGCGAGEAGSNGESGIGGGGGCSIAGPGLVRASALGLLGLALLPRRRRR